MHNLISIKHQDLTYSLQKVERMEDTMKIPSNNSRMWNILQSNWPELFKKSMS